MTPANPNRPKTTFLRNLGQFFGHIAHGIATPAQGQRPVPQQGAARQSQAPFKQPPPAMVRRETHEQQVVTPQGKMVLRRTIIDEVRPADDQH